MAGSTRRRTASGGAFLVTASLAIATVLLASLVTTPLAASSDRVAYEAVPKATCGPDDLPETALQGQVPAADRASGRSQEGYRCNLELVGQFQGEGASWQHAWYGDCAYYDTANDPDQEHPGTVVIDASNRRKPKATEYLTEPAMLDPWESLKVNHKRGLLAGVERGRPGFAVYHLKKDCAHPKLLASVAVPNTAGHAGDFAPDGRTYYGSNSGGLLYAIDITDPTKPKKIAHWELPNAVHDLSLSEDGTRAYLTQKNTPFAGSLAPNGLMIVDTSDVQQRRKNPEYRVIGELYWEDGATAQMTQPVTIDGKPYVIFVDEFGAGGMGAQESWLNACARGLPPFAFARIIDISDEREPKIVSKLMLEVQLPQNCPLTTHDDASIFYYDSHYCTVDNPRDARLLGCSYFQSGLRVFDIRDPAHPKEIAYYNPPARPNDDLPGSQHSNFAATQTADWTTANVRFRLDRREIWFTSQDNGFHIVRFTKPLRKLLESSHQHEHDG